MRRGCWARHRGISSADASTGRPTLTGFWKRLAGRGGRRKAQRIVLHVGLGKCASSAIQFWADGNRDWLLARGVDYPPCDPKLPYPKHQGLVTMLQAEERAYLDGLIDGSRAGTLMLSTEGLSNRMESFSEAAFEKFRAATSGLPVDIFFVQRDLEAWVRSRYKEMVLNRPGPSGKYGLPLHLEEFRSLPRIQRQTDFDMVFTDCVRGYNARNAVRIDLKDGWLVPLAALLGVDPRDGATPPVAANVSVSDDLAELVRQVNGMGLDDHGRTDFLALVQLSEQTRHRVLEVALEATRKQAADRAALVGVLDRLAPQTAGQIAAIERLGATLGRLGPTW